MLTLPGTTIPAFYRSDQPSLKDKSLVENAVKNVYYRIYASLADQEFYSIDELNRAVVVELEKLNHRPFQRRNISWKELFEEIEKKEL